MTATLLFALAFLAQLDGYDNGRVETLGLAVGLAAEGQLTLGDALVPGRAERGHAGPGPSDPV